MVRREQCGGFWELSKDTGGAKRAMDCCGSCWARMVRREQCGGFWEALRSNVQGPEMWLVGHKCEIAMHRTGHDLTSSKQRQRPTETDRERCFPGSPAVSAGVLRPTCVSSRCMHAHAIVGSLCCHRDTESFSWEWVDGQVQPWFVPCRKKTTATHRVACWATLVLNGEFLTASVGWTTHGV